MRINVLFFASLREQLGTSGEELDLPPDVATVSALRSYLSQRGEKWKGALGEPRLLRAAVNQEMVGAAGPIKAGDEIAFFPPVTGG